MNMTKQLNFYTFSEQIKWTVKICGIHGLGQTILKLMSAENDGKHN